MPMSWLPDSVGAPRAGRFEGGEARDWGAGRFGGGLGRPPTLSSHTFYDRLQMILLGAGFDAFVEDPCNPYCAAKMGAPSLRPCIWWAILKDTMPPGRRDTPSSAAGRREDAPRPTETPFCSSFGRIAPRPLVIVANIGGAPRGAGRPRQARAHSYRNGWRVRGR